MAMPNRIRELREALEKSQAWLAKAANTSPQQIDRLEKGERRLTDDWMNRLAPPLGVEPYELMNSHTREHKDGKSPQKPGSINPLLTSSPQPQGVGSHRAGREEMLAMEILELRNRLKRVEGELEELRLGKQQEKVTKDPQ